LLFQIHNLCRYTQGCFAQLVIDVTLAEFKRNAARHIDGRGCHSLPGVTRLLT
jgi:hypothetical protein